jgi:hypothetical protein
VDIILTSNYHEAAHVSTGKEGRLTMHYTWSNLRLVAALVAARWRERVTRIRVTPLSAEWLRAHEIDASKHVSDR